MGNFVILDITILPKKGLRDMSWKKFLLGVGIGVAGALLVNEVRERSLVPADAALKSVKEAFKKKGPIDGSWIHMVPETMMKNQFEYQVYRGGITRTVDSQQEQYEFIVDAKTGTLLDLQEM